MALDIIKELLVEVRATAAEFQADMAKIVGTADASSGAMSRGFNTLSKVGKVALFGIAAAVGVVAVAGTKLAIDYNDVFSLIQTQTGKTTAVIEGLKRTVLGLASTGQTPIALANALLGIYHAGLRGAAALAVLRNSAMAATSTNATLTDVTNAVSSAVKAWGARNLSARDATDILTVAVSKSKIAWGDVSAVFGRLLPLAAGAKLKLQDVTAAVATMAQEGLTGTRAVMGLSSLIGALVAPSTGAAKALKDVGLSAKDVRDEIASKGLLPTLQDLIKRTHGNVAALKLLLGSTTAVRLALTLAGAHAKDYARNLKELQGSTQGAGATAKQFAERSKDISVELKKWKAWAEAVAIRIGEWLIPKIQAAVTWITKHKAAAEALGAVIGGFLLVAIAAYIVSMASAAVATIAATWPILAIIAAVAALVLGILYLSKHWKQIWDAIKRETIAIWNGIVAFFKSIPHRIMEGLKDLRHLLGDLAKRAWHAFLDGMHQEWNLILTFVKSIPHRIVDGLKDLGHLLLRLAKDSWRQHWDGMKAIWKDIIGWVKRIPHNIVHALGNLGSMLLQAGKDIMHGLLNGIKAAVGDVYRFVTGIPSHIVGAFKGLLGISSPSKVFHEIGVNMMAGLHAGIGSQLRSVQAAIADAADATGQGPGVRLSAAGSPAGARIMNFTLQYTGAERATSKELTSDLMRMALLYGGTFQS